VDFSSTTYECTDMQLTPEKTHVVLSGHGGPKVNGMATYSGRMSKVEIATATMAWSKSFTAGGPPELIYNECFGIAIMADGSYAMSCGTGIEVCGDELKTQTLKDNCNKGLGDERPGAIPRGAGIWQLMTIRTDPNGNLQEQRVDSYKDPTWGALGSANMQQSSSGAEWPIALQDGSLVLVTDEVFGVGLLKMTAITSGGGFNSGDGSTGDGSNSASCTYKAIVDDCKQARGRFGWTCEQVSACDGKGFCGTGTTWNGSQCTVDQ